MIFPEREGRGFLRGTSSAGNDGDDDDDGDDDGGGECCMLGWMMGEVSAACWAGLQ